MSNITDKAKEYLSYKLSVLPTKEDQVRVLIETRGEGGLCNSYNGVREVELGLKTLKNREGELNQTAILIFDKWTGVITDQKSNNSDPFR